MNQTTRYIFYIVAMVLLILLLTSGVRAEVGVITNEPTSPPGLVRVSTVNQASSASSEVLQPASVRLQQ